MIILLGSFILFVLLSIPIAFSLGLSVLVTLMVTKEMPLEIITQSMIKTLDSFPLLAVPLFIFSGVLMEYGGLSERLVNVARSFVSHYRGGLATVAIIASAFFAALSGSGPATVAAIGGFMIPAMQREKYDLGFSAGILASAGTLGIIIPPSIPLIIYGVVTDTSVSDLFIAGIIPGIVVAFCLWLVSYFILKKQDFQGKLERHSWSERLKLLNQAKATLILPVIILGGIYGGIFTPTEAAAIAVIYSAFIGIFVYKKIKLNNVVDILRQSIFISGTILIIISIAATYSRILTIEQIPQEISQFLINISDEKWVILTLILLFLVFIGMFMETISVIILLAPILLPIVSQFGIEPIHFGIIMILAAEIGFLTPPVGDNINVASVISGLSLERVSVSTLPFTITLFVLLIIVTFFPILTMFLPNLM